MIGFRNRQNDYRDADDVVYDADTRFRSKEPWNGSIAGMIKDVRDDAMLLFKQEIALAKTEISRDAKAAGQRMGKAIGAGVGLLFATGLLLVGLCWLVGFGLACLFTWGFEPVSLAIALGFLLVGGVIATVCGLIMKKAVAELQEIDPTPHQTIQSLQSPQKARKEAIEHANA